jgi:hypothetical protein
MALRRSTRVPLLTGEKLEMVRRFKPFLDSQAVDIIHLEKEPGAGGGVLGMRGEAIRKTGARGQGPDGAPSDECCGALAPQGDLW